MPELVLYGIRLLAKQFLGAILDIEVDQCVPASASLSFMAKVPWPLISASDKRMLLVVSPSPYLWTVTSHWLVLT